MAIDVRQATVDDVAGVRRVARRSWHAAHDHIVGEDAVDEFLAEHYREERLQQLINDPTSVWFVAIDDEDGVVGFAAAVPRDEDEGTFVLGSIYVHPDRWGERIGTELIDRIEAAVRSRDGDRLRLVVMADNDLAIGFYEARGFRRVDDHYDDNLDVRGYVYAKDLS